MGSPVKYSLSSDLLGFWWAKYFETLGSHYTSDLPQILSHVLNLAWSHRSIEFRLPADVNSQLGTCGFEEGDGGRGDLGGPVRGPCGFRSM